jgi:hypothetical protein
MKKLGVFVAAASAIAFAAPAFATGATLRDNPNAKAQGSNVGVFSSQVRGNGAVIGGGTKGTGQTTSPGSRATEVQTILGAEGRGRVNAKSK